MEVKNYRNTVKFFEKYHCTGDHIHEITDFRLRDASEILNTEQNLHKLPYRRPKTFQIPNTVI